MKKKSIITVASIGLNLALFSALLHFNKINSLPTESLTPFFRVQHLAAMGYAQSDSRRIVLASTVK
jgi:hypothetical protein